MNKPLSLQKLEKRISKLKFKVHYYGDDLGDSTKYFWEVTVPVKEVEEDLKKIGTNLTGKTEFWGEDHYDILSEEGIVFQVHTYKAGDIAWISCPGLS